MGLQLQAPLAVLLLAAAISTSHACIYLYGSMNELGDKTGTHFTYAYTGLDWPEEFDTCNGERQSPISIPTHSPEARVPAGEETIFDYSKLTAAKESVKLLNNGHTVQMVFPKDYVHNVTVATPGDVLTSKFSNSNGTPDRLKVTPTQLHFHTRSEHLVQGRSYPLEMHIVNFVYNDTLPACGAAGCPTVVGVFFEETDDETEANPFITAIFNAMPDIENTTSFLPAGTELDFSQILPADRSYISYEGSLTTPPCTEGILWHVLLQPMKITKKQLAQFEMATGETMCPETKAAPSPGISFIKTAMTPDNCTKLANGQNFRDVQARNNRPVLLYTAEQLCPVPAGLKSTSLGAVNPDGTQLSVQVYQLMHDINLTAPTKADCPKPASGVGALLPAPVALLFVLVAAVFMMWA